MELLLIVLFGLLVGLSIGATSTSPGTLTVLVLLLGADPATAVGCDIAFCTVTKVVGSASHFRQGTVDVPLSLWMAIGSLPAAIGGVVTLELLESSAGEAFNSILLVALGAAMVLGGAGVLVQTLYLSGREQPEDSGSSANKIGIVVLGATIGFILGVTAAGSGSLITLGLLLFFRMGPHRVVGTALFHGTILSGVAAVAHGIGGNIDFALVGLVLLGSIPGVLLGARVASRMPERGLRPALAALMILAALPMFNSAGVTPPPQALAVCVVAIGAVMLVTRLLRRPTPAPVAASLAARTG